MNAKFIFLDFVNYLFLLALIIFVIAYIIVGGRLEMFEKIMKSLVPFAYYGMGLVYFIERKRKQRIKLIEETNFDEIVAYKTIIDRIKDLFVIVFLSFVIIVLVAYRGDLRIDDVFQALLIFASLFLWQFFIFQKDFRSSSYIIYRKTILYDDIFIVFLPIIIYLSVYIVGAVPVFIDIFQAIIPYIVMYLWHDYLLEKKVIL